LATSFAPTILSPAAVDQIVAARRVYGMVENFVEARPIDDLHLKGFNHPVLAVEILRWREEGEDLEVSAAPRRRKRPS